MTFCFRVLIRIFSFQLDKHTHSYRTNRSSSGCNFDSRYDINQWGAGGREGRLAPKFLSRRLDQKKICHALT
jgi:hypothetical protein